MEEPVPPSVVKIRHYVRIVRWNRGGYGREGNRVHAHNTSKAYINKARVFEQDQEELEENMIWKWNSTHKVPKMINGILDEDSYEVGN